MTRWQEIVKRSKALAEQEALKYQASPGVKTQLRKLAFNYGIERMEFREMSGDAMLIRRPNKGYTIALNQAHPKSRHRFSIAHEIGHLLLEPLIGQRAIHRRKLSRGQDPEGRRIETLCDNLAASILMPKKIVDELATDSGWSATCLRKIAGSFDVSFEASARRFVGVHPDPCALVIWKSARDGKPTYERSTVASEPLGRCWIKFIAREGSAVLKVGALNAVDTDQLVRSVEDVEIVRGYGAHATARVSKGVRTETFCHGKAPYQTYYSVLHFGNEA